MSTQRINKLSAVQETDGVPGVSSPAWLQNRLFAVPHHLWHLLIRLLRPRFSLALLTPVLCGVMLGWWQGATVHLPTLSLLLAGSAATIVGLNLLHEYHDYWHARRSNDVRFHQIVFATAYHLMAAEHVTASTVRWLAHGLLFIGLLCYLGLVSLLGWPLLFFYATSLILIYTYTAPPIRYGYRGWAMGELGLFLGYGLFPLVGSYYIIGHTLDWLPVFAGVPFGLIAILLFANYNFVHHRRDWLMRKRTLVVNFGPRRAMDINSLLTVLVYAGFLCLVSLAYLPMIVLITLAALPLAVRIYGQLRAEEVGLIESFQLYRATVTATLCTALLFMFALFVNGFF
ncbi:MAG: prenyltransferase [Caldilineaceae bacterium]|nr:prenyltransferase [Caldilineaceae bacterium]